MKERRAGRRSSDIWDLRLANFSHMIFVGIIPRAALALFEHLDAPTAAGNRQSLSGLRAPVRYSQSGPPKAISKNWTIKATYVEVSG